jgi:hypothetical protein
MSALLGPLAFGLASRRFRASGISRIHVVRVWCYSLPRLAAVAILATAIPRLCYGVLALAAESLDWIGFEIDLGSRYVAILLRSWHGEFIAAAIIFFMWRWWSCAFRDYLELPSPGFLAAKLLFIAFAAWWFVVVQAYAVAVAVEVLLR